MPGAVEFFYDYISPNAYLAWPGVRDIAVAHERDLVLKPVLFAGLLQAHSQAGPAEVAPKMQWMVRNCLRKASHLGVAFAPPYSHPFNPLPGLRITLAAATADRDRLTDTLFRAVWAESRDISDVATMAAILRENDFDPDQLIAAAQSPAIKTRLRTETDAAVARGVFGVPTMIVDEQLFFGFDDLPWLERYLCGDDLLDARQYADWQTVKPSAWRKK